MRRARYQSRRLDAGVLLCVYGAQDTVLDAWGDDSQAVTAHEDYRVVCRSTIFGFGEIGGERLTEVGVSNEHVLGVIWSVVL